MPYRWCVEAVPQVVRRGRASVGASRPCFSWSVEAVPQSVTLIGWPALSTRRLSHYCTFIYKAILGVLPSYVCSLIMRKSAGPHFLRSQDLVLLSVPNVRTEQGKKAFVYSTAPTVWNTLQKDLGLVELFSVENEGN